ncbi:hypothetical protein [Paenibacillus sp. FSL A5-0031]|nr:hypothetical protein [Paenibacillus sp. FSL A5-0031]
MDVTQLIDIAVVQKTNCLVTLIVTSLFATKDVATTSDYYQ